MATSSQSDAREDRSTLADELATRLVRGTADEDNSNLPPLKACIAVAGLHQLLLQGEGSVTLAPIPQPLSLLTAAEGLFLRSTLPQPAQGCQLLAVAQAAVQITITGSL